MEPWSQEKTIEFMEDCLEFGNSLNDSSSSVDDCDDEEDNEY